MNLKIEFKRVSSCDVTQTKLKSLMYEKTVQNESYGFIFYNYLNGIKIKIILNGCIFTNKLNGCEFLINYIGFFVVIPNCEFIHSFRQIKWL